MTRPITPDSAASALGTRLADLRPTLFRVVLGLAGIAFTLLFQLYLVNEGHMAGIPALGVVASLVIGALAYWLAQSFVFFLIIFCPVVAIAALVVSLWGGFGR